MIEDNINKLKISSKELENKYEILYKKNNFLNDNILLDKETKKIFKIHELNNNKYSIGDIYELYLNYLNENKLLNEDYVNLDNIIKNNLNTEKKTIFLKEFFKLIKIKFIH